MNARELSEIIQKPEPTIASAVRALGKNPDDFNEEVSAKVRSILTGGIEEPNQKKLGGKKEATPPNPKKSSEESSVVNSVLKNAIAAQNTIAEEQIAALLRDSRQQGQVVGALSAMEFYLGVEEEQARMRAELFLAHQEARRSFWATIMGKQESLLATDVPALAFQRNKEVPPANYLAAWQDRNNPASAYTTD